MGEATTDTGFVKVECERCKNPDVWLRCERCRKADHFRLENGVVVCTCDARYDHGKCLCGNEVPAANLKFVPWDDGPLQLAELEWAWDRIAVLVVAAVLIVGFGVWAVFLRHG